MRNRKLLQYRKTTAGAQICVKAEESLTDDMKCLCSNAYPWGQNLLLFSVTAVERIQRCQLSGKKNKKEKVLRESKA